MKYWFLVFPFYCVINILSFGYTEPINISPNTVAVFDDEQSIDDLTGQTDFDSLTDRRITIRWDYSGDKPVTDWHVYYRKGEGGYFYLDRTGNSNNLMHTWIDADVNVQYQFRVWGLYRNEQEKLRLIVLNQPGPMGYNLTGGNEINLKKIDNPDDIPVGTAIVVDDLSHGTDLSGGADYDSPLECVLALKFNPGNGDFTNVHIYVSVDGLNYSTLGQTGAVDIFYYRFDDKGTFSLLDNTWKNGPQDGTTYWFRIFALINGGGAVRMDTGPVKFWINPYPTSTRTLIPNLPVASNTPTPIITPTNTPESNLTIDLTLPFGAKPLEMRLIPAGTFMMGSPDNEQDHASDECPQHQVTISQPFFLGKYEVTQAQWQAIMGNSPSDYQGNNLPVEKVSWNDCQDFITALNQLGQGTFRLPTEAEWEYACRAGTTTRFYWGDDPDYSQIMDYAWNRNPDGTNEVGMKLPNAFGLYDMSGNVWEWCQDWFSLYSSNAQTDPTGPTGRGSLRIIRGGGWDNYAMYSRSAFRNCYLPTLSLNYLGFRLLRSYP